MEIRVIIADDFPLIRGAIADALESDPGITVIGQACDGVEALELVAAGEPDIVLLDLHMPRMGGLAVLERLREQHPNVRVLVLTASEKADLFLEAVGSGAEGYITKRASRRELINAVVTVHGGGSVIAPSMTGYLLHEYSGGSRGATKARPMLARREQEVLRLVASGYTDKQIGETLFISPRTVQNHLTRIREKTGLRRRSELARWAVEHTWV